VTFAPQFSDDAPEKCCIHRVGALARFPHGTPRVQNVIDISNPKGIVVALTAGLLLFQLAVPALAHGRVSFRRQEDRATRCPARKTILRIDSRVCPATRRRPAIVIQRACCENPNGNVKCKPYGKCPPRSPS